MNQTALITGASKRIGKTIAEHLAQKGWNIAIHYNNSIEDANRLTRVLSLNYPKQQFSAIKTNLSNIEEVISLIPKLISKTGVFNLLVNNASVFNTGFLTETSTELFCSQMDVNFKAPFFLMRDFANYCKQGNVINLVDTRITKNKTDYAAYSLSKKALWELTKMAALEFAPEIRVNAIAPGATLAPETEDENYLNELASHTPMKRPGGLDPIIKSLDYILNNKHLTGQLLFADGGENLGKNN